MAALSPGISVCGVQLNQERRKFTSSMDTAVTKIWLTILAVTVKTTVAPTEYVMNFYRVKKYLWISAIHRISSPTISLLQLLSLSI
jgi:hypothetical protein